MLKLGVPSKGRLMEKTFDWFGARGLPMRRAGTEREYSGAVDGIEGVDLVLFYKHLMVLEGHSAYALHFNESDALSTAQRNFVEAEWRRFKSWYANWAGEGRAAKAA